MKKFQYNKTLDTSKLEMNKIGEEGWELVTVVEGIFYWKREV